MQLNHAYPARRLPDGSYEIDGLDIFETCARRNPHTGAVDLFDVGWLLSAAERANAREAAGYLAPVHLGHHGPHGAAPPFAGFLRNLRVELRSERAAANQVHACATADAAPAAPSSTSGAAASSAGNVAPASSAASVTQAHAAATPTPGALLCEAALTGEHVDDAPQPSPAAVLRATLTGIPAEVFSRIAARRLPYRSVEIHDPAEPEVSSLALLDSVVPFFKFPITNVALAEAEKDTQLAANVRDPKVARAGVAAAKQSKRSPQDKAQFEDVAETPGAEVEAQAVSEAVAVAGGTRFAEHAGRLHALARFQGLPWSTAEPPRKHAEPVTAAAAAEHASSNAALPSLRTLLAQAEQAVHHVACAAGLAESHQPRQFLAANEAQTQEDGAATAAAHAEAASADATANEQAKPGGGSAPAKATTSVADDAHAEAGTPPRSMLDDGLRALSAEGYVFAEDAVQRLVAQSTNPAAAFAALRRVLPKAPVAAEASSAVQASRDATQFELDASSVPGDPVDQVLHALGRAHDAATRRLARKAAAEYAAQAERFHAIGCTFSEADYIRARVAPVTYT